MCKEYNKNEIFKGIYCITNTINGKKYIGSSKSVHKRLREHQLDLAAKRHSNSKLQRAYNKYGKENFDISIIQTLDQCVSDIEMRKIEGELSEKHKTYSRKYGYNVIKEKGQTREFTKEVKARKTARQRERFGRRVLLIDILTLDKLEFKCVSTVPETYGLETALMTRFRKQLIIGGYLYIYKDKLSEISNLAQFISTKLMRLELYRQPILDVEAGVYYFTPNDASLVYGNIVPYYMRYYKTWRNLMKCDSEYDFVKQKRSDEYERFKGNSLTNSKYLVLDLLTGIYYDGMTDACIAYEYSKSDHKRLIRNPRFLIEKIANNNAQA